MTRAGIHQVAEGLAEEAWLVLIARGGVYLLLPADHTSDDQEDFSLGKREKQTLVLLNPKKKICLSPVQMWTESPSETQDQKYQQVTSRMCVGPT